MKKLQVCICIIILSIISFQKANGQQWIKEYPFAACIFTGAIGDKDSGIVFTPFDPYVNGINLLKTDVNGNIYWKRVYQIDGHYIYPSGISRDNNGHIFLFGNYTTSDTGKSIPVFVRLNECYDPENTFVYYKPGASSRIDQVIGINSSIFTLRFSYLKLNYTHIAPVDTTGAPLWFNTLDSESGTMQYRKGRYYYIGSCYRPFTDGSDIVVNRSIYDIIDSLGKLDFEEIIDVKDSSTASYGADLVFLNDFTQIQLINDRSPNSAHPMITNSVMIAKKNGNQTTSAKVLSDTSVDNVPFAIIQINANRYLISSNSYKDTLSLDNSFTRLYLIDSNLNILKTKNIDTSLYQQTIGDHLLKLSGNEILLYNQRIKNAVYKPLAIKIDTNLNTLSASSINKTYDYWCGHQVSDSTVNINSYTLIDLSNDTFPLGIKKQINPAAKSKTNYAIYPNPGNGELRIWIEKPGLLKDILVMDVTGRIIQQIPVSQADESLNLTALERGIYFIQALGRQGEIIFSERYLKNH